MTKRLASLRRLHRLQTQVTALADSRLAVLGREQVALGAERDLLQAFVAEIDSDGQALANAANKRQIGLHQRLAASQVAADQQKDRRQESRRREKALEAAGRNEAVLARRADEARDLAAVMESWLAAQR